MLNWSSKKDYEYTKTLSDVGWAWEFLKRNPEYRKDYGKFCAERKALQDADRDGEASSPLWGFRPSDPWSKAHRYEPPPKEGESMGEWLARLSRDGKLPRRYSLQAWYARRWGLDRRMPNPDDLDSSQVKFLPPDTYPQFPKWDDTRAYFVSTEGGEEGPGAIVCRVDKRLVGFDLTRPLVPQVKVARKLLLEEQKRLKAKKEISVYQTKLRKEPWPRYLRALDARSQGVSFNEIADVLFPKQENNYQKAHETFKAAEGMMREGYRYIPFKHTHAAFKA